LTVDKSLARDVFGQTRKPFGIVTLAVYCM